MSKTSDDIVDIVENGIINKKKEFIESIIFNIKWLLIPAYLNLAWFLCKLLFNFIVYQHVSNNNIMESLEAVDIIMIANLIVMIITGSYTSFVSKEHNGKTEKTSSGLLKVKLATSIMGVASIHLLQTFISSQAINWDTVNKQIAIYGIFIIGSLALAVIDYLHEKSH